MGGIRGQHDPYARPAQRSIRVAHLDPSAEPCGRAGHEREAHAARPGVARLGRDPELQHARPHRGIHARSVVRHLDDERAGVGPRQRELDAAAVVPARRGDRRILRRVDRVVDEVPDDRHELRRGHARVARAVGHPHGQRHAALGRLRGLAAHERPHDGIRVRRQPALRRPPVRLQLRGRERERLARPLQLDERHDGVQPVRELVRLRPHGVREGAKGRELARQALDLRPVPQRRHRAEPRGAAGSAGGQRRPLRDHEDAPAGQVHDLVRRRPRDEQPFDRGRHPQLVHLDGTGGGIQLEVEQLGCLVVVEDEPPVAVDEHDALADRVQHRLVVREHARHHLGPQPPRRPREGPAEEHGTCREEQRERPDRAEEPGEARAEHLGDAVDGTPAATSPTMPPSASRTGTTARTLGPSVPVKVSVSDRPARAGPVVPRYLRPISSGSGWGRARCRGP